MVKCPHCKQPFGANEIRFNPFSDERGDPSDYGIYSCPKCDSFLGVGEGESGSDF
jgi:hypothetical protein